MSTIEVGVLKFLKCILGLLFRNKINKGETSWSAIHLLGQSNTFDLTKCTSNQLCQ